MRWLSLLMIVGCSTPETACLDQCAAFVRLAEECPADSLGPFDDVDALRNGCETWAWEISLLASDAGERNVLKDACTSAAEDAQTGDCGVLSSFDYDALPWQ